MKLKFVSGLIQIASLRFIKALEGSEDYIECLLFAKVLTLQFASFFQQLQRDL